MALDKNTDGSLLFVSGIIPNGNSFLGAINSATLAFVSFL